MRSDGPKEYGQEISSNAKDAVVTRGPGVVVAAAILTACIITTVVLRVYTRFRIQKWFGPDDIFAVLALVCMHFLNDTYIVEVMNVRFMPAVCDSRIQCCHNGWSG